MRFIVFSVLLGTILLSQTVFCQEQDSLQAQEQVTDAASNRLFWMSTGKISAPHRVSIGLFSFLLLQGGYTPTDFFQMNASLTFGYWSLGTKFQLVQETGLLKGISIGADFGFSPNSDAFFINRDNISAFTLSGSFGKDNVQFHLASFVVGQPEKNFEGMFPPSLQTGLEIGIDKKTGRLSKLMTEVWWVYESSEKRYSPALIMVGGRSYGPTFIIDFAFIIGPNLCFGHCSSSSRLRVYPFPYISLMWFIPS